MSLPETLDKTLPDAWDFKGRPAERGKSGGWGSASMILGVEAIERLTTLGIGVNLVTYLTGTMHLSNAISANTVTNFLGTSFMLTLFGGFVADTFLGRYLTIAIFTTVQATGVTILTISTIIPSLRPPKCTPDSDGSSTSCIPANGTQLMVLHIALYLTALGTGGLKSSVSGLGSDQFDDSDPKERSIMLGFFNWFFFCINIGALGAVTVLVYIQDHVGRDWGYGICACAIVFGLLIFLSGTKRYRFKKLAGSPLTQIAAVLVAAWRKRNMELPSDPLFLYNIDGVSGGRMKGKQMLPHTEQFLFLDKAAIKDQDIIESGATNKWNLSSLTDVEEVKMVIRMLPIWATTIMFWTVYAQMTTFSVSQATTMDRHIGSFQIPGASLTVFFVVSVLLTVPIYDRLVAPIARKLLHHPQGLTPLQKIGVGLVLAIIAMVAAALCEIKRLGAAKSHGLTEDPNAEIPLTVFWLMPQFILIGIGEALTYIGQLDFFLKECPKGMKTISTGLFLSTIALGFFVSSTLVTIVHNVTYKNPWLADNINKGKLYDFYWLLAILSVFNFAIFLFCAKWYVYKDKRLAEVGIELEEDDGAAFH
ncbi:protein NRT1/ PTR FAMILY 6.3-like [Rutidosis leptorrhynchoides]|uniref:protein NRT1/ PTR FAMILY 6.3-like n=1 Tax=Rutidosis leptorrhynchoides TaxID=125765 RepID=UPI003A997DD7